MKAKKVVMFRVLPLLMILALMFTKLPVSVIGSLTGNEVEDLSTVSAAENYGLAENIQDGTILHCFDWKYNDIKAELPNIAEAGFTSVQTSPAQKDESYGTWYMLYQPQSFSIQENALGTKAELQELCTEADKYGIKIIVDVVANHMRGDGTNVIDDMSVNNHSDYWHHDDLDSGRNIDWTNRYQVTHGRIGMYDLNSENTAVQSKVAAYINELKGVGVDGIRWDAAKHIGLPSESCQFWPAVTSQGLYHYGEILKGPDDRDSGNEDLMKEYTSYMSVTDSDYGKQLRDAFNSGQAPTSYGNWAARGVNSNKLVYWGESHDTWSNNKDWGYSNEMSQNVIDRAYAVAASRNNVTALYFSRPASKVKDEIKAGEKGSTHFKEAKEVAAINHFHNAMIGQEDYFVNSNNCAVVCREKGAVIVKGSGSGQVTVENGNGTTEPGTYTDEITGNVWTVTKDTISGEIGSSGIAVIYNPEPIHTEKVDATSTTGSNTFTTATLDVKLVAKNVTNPTYTTTEGASGSYTDGDTITIGSSVAEGGDVQVTVKGTGASGEVTKTVTFTKQAKPSYWKYIDGSYDVYVKKPSGWGTSMKCYAYVDENTNNGQWPGVAMQSLGEEIYAYHIPDGWTSASVIFNDGSNQYPASQQPGLAWTAGTSMAYIDGEWIKVESPAEKGTVTVKYVDESGTEIATSQSLQGEVGSTYTTSAVTVAGYSLQATPSNATGSYTKETIIVTYVYTKDVEDTPKVTVSFAEGSTFETESKEITLTLENAQKGTYCVDDGPVKEFTDSVKVVIGQGKIADSTVTVKATATSGSTTKDYTFTYNKKFKDTINEVMVTNAANACEEELDAAGAANADLASQYKRNPNNGVGVNKTIAIDGDLSDWNSSMLIARGAANDDPRVYRPDSMHELPIDLYALYGAYDDDNLYLMWEMTNVQDVVAPNADYPLSRGILWETQELPFFIAVDTGKSEDAIKNKGALQEGGTIWNSGMTITNSFNRLISINTKGGNGPYVYGGDSTGLNPVEILNATTSHVEMGFGKGILSKEVWGIDKAYGENNNRVVGDVCNNSAAWVDFNQKEHSSSTLDFFYELSIPYEELGITKSDVESNGVGVLLVATFGKSAMDCLPYDVSMNDHADQADTESQAKNSLEKSDQDEITTAFARIGKAGSGDEEDFKLNFGADRSAPQAVSTTLTLKGVASGGKAPYTYRYTVNETEIGSGTSVNWSPAASGKYALACTATDAEGNVIVSSKYYTVEDGENPPECKHTNTEIRNKKDATCTEAGYTGDTYCKLCNDLLQKGTGTAALGHTETLKDVSEATCTNQGYTGDNYCTRCNTVTKTGKTIPALGHDFDMTTIRNAKEATCTEAGYTGDIYCTRCQATVKGDKIPALGHDFDMTTLQNAREATCTEAGYTGDGYCNRCQAEAKGTTIPALGHDFDSSTVRNAKDPTCTEAGYTGDGYCNRCQTEAKGTTISALGHDFSGRIINRREATCTMDGYTGDTYCIRCTVTARGKVIHSTGHDFHGSVVNKKEATCTMDGYTGDTCCLHCTQKKSGQSISATGHSWNDGTVTRKATATENGVKTYRCNVCQAAKEEVIPATGTGAGGSTGGTTGIPDVGDSVDDEASNATYRVTQKGKNKKEVEYVLANSKTETVEVPDTVKIGDEEYQVTAISSEAFKDHKSVKTVVIGDYVKTIGEGAFRNCKNLTKVTMGKNVTTISAKAFYKCSKLTTVKMSSKVQTIGNYAFYKCTKLKSITIPSKVKTIGKYAFYGCKNLKSITVKTTKLTSKSVGKKAFKGTYSRAKITVPRKKFTSYEKIFTDKGVSSKAKFKKQ